jgi:transglutaminase-like putative cysteine protease
MATSIYPAQYSANLRSTAILDVENQEIQALARRFADAAVNGAARLRQIHNYLIGLLTPVYSVKEWQPASVTLVRKRGSCSQRMALLEATARAIGVPTRVRVLDVNGEFWYPRFRFWRIFVPDRILLLWPQFLLDGEWLDFDELHGPVTQLAKTSAHGFTNDAESLFEAVEHTPVDFLGKTCGLANAVAGHDLSRFVLADKGFFDTRDEALKHFGTFYGTWRGRAFELLFGDRKSSC